MLCAGGNTVHLSDAQHISMFRNPPAIERKTLMRETIMLVTYVDPFVMFSGTKFLLAIYHSVNLTFVVN